MDSVVYYGSVGQHVELRSLSDSLIVPLKSGLSSFITVSGILLSINADMILPGSQTFDDIRRQIMNMKRQMEESERLAKAKLEQVDRAMATLTVQHSQLEQEKRQKNNELNNLNTQLSSFQSTLNSYKQALATARSNLLSAELTMRHMKEKMDEAQTVRDVGFGIMAIPIVGWIAGGIMIGVGQEDMNQAYEAVNTARQEVDNWAYYVNLYSIEAQRHNSLISEARRDISAVDNKIRETEAKLRDMSVKRRVVADIQDKIRRTVTQLGLLSGVGRVVELQTRRHILLEPVMRLLEEMTSTLREISGNELLYREGIPSLVENMKRNHRKLKELADSRSSADIDGYI